MSSVSLLSSVKAFKVKSTPPAIGRQSEHKPGSSRSFNSRYAAIEKPSRNVADWSEVKLKSAALQSVKLQNALCSAAAILVSRQIAAFRVTASKDLSSLSLRDLMW